MWDSEEHTSLDVEVFDFTVREKASVAQKSHRHPGIQSLPLLKRFGMGKISKAQVYLSSLQSQQKWG